MGHRLLIWLLSLYKWLLLAFIAMLLVGFVGCWVYIAYSEVFVSGRTPDSIEEISRRIKSVKYFGEAPTRVLQVELSVVSSSGGLWFFRESEEMFKVARDLKAHFPEDQEGVFFSLNTRLVDAYGNTSEEPAMRVAFIMEDIRRINFDNPNFTSYNLLELAHEVQYLHPVARDLVDTYCVDRGNERFAPSFCGSLLQ